MHAIAEKSARGFPSDALVVWRHLGVHFRSDRLVSHISTNFQATSGPERAFDILDAGGILSIKAHITKTVPGHMHLDGVDDLYMNYLDRLFNDIEQRYGDAIDWTTSNRLAASLSASSLTVLPEETTVQTRIISGGAPRRKDRTTCHLQSRIA